MVGSMNQVDTPAGSSDPAKSISPDSDGTTVGKMEVRQFPMDIPTSGPSLTSLASISSLARSIRTGHAISVGGTGTFTKNVGGFTLSPALSQNGGEGTASPLPVMVFPPTPPLPLINPRLVERQGASPSEGNPMTGSIGESLPDSEEVAFAKEGAAPPGAALSEEDTENTSEQDLYSDGPTGSDDEEGESGMGSVPDENPEGQGADTVDSSEELPGALSETMAKGTDPAYTCLDPVETDCIQLEQIHRELEDEIREHESTRGQLHQARDELKDVSHNFKLLAQQYKKVQEDAETHVGLLATLKDDCTFLSESLQKEKERNEVICRDVEAYEESQRERDAEWQAKYAESQQNYTKKCEEVETLKVTLQETATQSEAMETTLQDRIIDLEGELGRQRVCVQTMLASHAEEKEALAEAHSEEVERMKHSWATTLEEVSSKLQAVEAARDEAVENVAVHLATIASLENSLAKDQNAAAAAVYNIETLRESLEGAQLDVSRICEGMAKMKSRHSSEVAVLIRNHEDSTLELEMRLEEALVMLDSSRIQARQNLESISAKHEERLAELEANLATERNYAATAIYDIETLRVSLEDAQLDVDRINSQMAVARSLHLDEVSALKEQLDAARAQAKATVACLDAKDDEISSLHDSVRNLQGTIADMEDLQESTAHIHMSRIMELENRLPKEGFDADTQTEDAVITTDAVKSLESEIQSLTEQLNVTRSTFHEKLSEAMEDAQAQVTNAESKLLEEERRCTEAVAAADGLRTDIARLNTTMKAMRDHHQETVDKVSAENCDLIAKNEKAHNTIRELVEKIVSSDAIVACESILVGAQGRLEELSTRMETLGSDVRTVRGRYETSVVEHSGAVAIELKEVKHALEASESSRCTAETAIASLQSQIEVLEQECSQKERIAEEAWEAAGLQSASAERRAEKAVLEAKILRESLLDSEGKLSHLEEKLMRSESVVEALENERQELQSSLNEATASLALLNSTPASSTVRKDVPSALSIGWLSVSAQLVESESRLKDAIALIAKLRARVSTLEGDVTLGEACLMEQGQKIAETKAQLSDAEERIERLQGEMKMHISQAQTYLEKYECAQQEAESATMACADLEASLNEAVVARMSAEVAAEELRKQRTSDSHAEISLNSVEPPDEDWQLKCSDLEEKLCASQSRVQELEQRLGLGVYAFNDFLKSDETEAMTPNKAFIENHCSLGNRADDCIPEREQQDCWFTSTANDLKQRRSPTESLSSFEPMFDSVCTPEPAFRSRSISPLDYQSSGFGSSPSGSSAMMLLRSAQSVSTASSIASSNEVVLDLTDFDDMDLREYCVTKVGIPVEGKSGTGRLDAERRYLQKRGLNKARLSELVRQGMFTADDEFGIMGSPKRLLLTLEPESANSDEPAVKILVDSPSHQGSYRNLFVYEEKQVPLHPMAESKSSWLRRVLSCMRRVLSLRLVCMVFIMAVVCLILVQYQQVTVSLAGLAEGGAEAVVEGAEWIDVHDHYDA